MTVLGVPIMPLPAAAASSADAAWSTTMTSRGTALGMVKRFLSTPNPANQPGQGDSIDVVMNWFTELRANVGGS